ncbi:hypothetical protein [Xylanimonas sp. McL0601]
MSHWSSSNADSPSTAVQERACPGEVATTASTVASGAGFIDACGARRWVG